MPGCVRLFVWGPAADTRGGRDENPELLQRRDVVVLNAVPGSAWPGFAAFLKSLANEYGSGVVQLYTGAPAAAATYPPDQLSSLPSALSCDHEPFVFPTDGELTLFIVLRTSPRSPLRTDSPSCGQVRSCDRAGHEV